MKVEKRVKKLFQGLVDTMVRTTVQTQRVDDPEKTLVDVKIPWSNHVQPFKVIWAGEGWPRDVRTAASDIKQPWPREYVIAASRFSPGSLEWLRSRDANWIDEQGHARIAGSHLVFNVMTDIRDHPKEHDLFEFSWSPSAKDVAALILAEPKRSLRIEDLAKHCEWSVSQISKVLRSFDGNGWTTKKGGKRGPKARRKAGNLDELLESWAEHQATHPTRRRLGHTLLQDPIDYLETTLAPAFSQELRWALTGWAAVQLTSPYLTTVPSLEVYVAGKDFDSRLTHAMNKLGISEVEEGERITFWEADGLQIALASGDDVPVASAPQLYADLLALGSARSRKAAQHIRETVIDASR